MLELLKHLPQRLCGEFLSSNPQPLESLPLAAMAGNRRETLLCAGDEEMPASELCFFLLYRRFKAFRRST